MDSVSGFDYTRENKSNQNKKRLPFMKSFLMSKLLNTCKTLSDFGSKYLYETAAPDIDSFGICGVTLADTSPHLYTAMKSF